MRSTDENLQWLDVRSCKASLALLAALMLGSAGCDNEVQPEVLVVINSPLVIGKEVKELRATLVPAGITVPFALGSPGEAVWPQTLPIFAGRRSPLEFDLTIELVNAAPPDQPEVVVGSTSAAAREPVQGVRTLYLGVPRACDDPDGDGYGIGPGCKAPDCAEMNSDIPANTPCPGGEAADGGMGTPGLMGCLGGTPCPDGQGCFANTCFPRCDTTDCADLGYGCVPFQTQSLCQCKVPCSADGGCGKFECMNGCCKL